MSSGGEFLCLICGDKCLPDNDDYNSSADDDQYNCFPNDTSVLSKDLHVYFILKHVLELPSEQLENYLRHCPSPKAWVKVCRDCTKNYVDKCKRIFGELVQVRRRFVRARIELIDAIKRSCRSEDGVKKRKDQDQEWIYDISKQTRGFVRQHEYGDPIIDEKAFIAGDLMASEKYAARTLPTHPQPHCSELTVKKDEILICENVKEEVTSYLQDDLDEAGEYLGGSDINDDFDYSSCNDNDGSSKDNELVEEGLSSDASSVSKKRSKGTGKTRTKKVRLSKVKLKFGENHENELECHLCQNTFQSKGILLEHLSQVHHIFQCEHCGKGFCHSKTLKRHIRDKHEESEPKFFCNFVGCDKSFQQKFLLVYHQKSHLAPQFKCHVCGKSFRVKAVLKRHMVNHENKQAKERQIHLCDLCPARYSYEGSLTSHWISVHGKNPVSGRDGEEHRCKLCRKVMSSKESLEYHNSLVHERKFEVCCDLCGKIFVKENSLKRHKSMVHEINVDNNCNDNASGGRSTKKLRCCVEGCDRRFGNETLLTHHLSLHQKGREFSCDHCGKRLFSRRNLRDHVAALHTTNRITKPFRCQECGKGFASKEYLCSHTKKIHQRPDQKD